MKTATLYDAAGNIVRQWQTDNPDYAMTADRNCPVGWRVAVA